MEHYQKAVYKTKLWQEVRKAVINRDKSICYFCGKIINKRATVHHKEEINEDNFMDYNVAFNMDNLVACHSRCHDQYHERFGFKSSIVNDDLSVNYRKREIKDENRNNR